MNYNHLRSAVRSISLSDEQKTSLIRNCLAAPCKNKRRRFLPAACAALLLVLSLSAYAGYRTGYFQDITDWRNAVIGTEYMQASEEIAVSAEYRENRLTVKVAFLFPEKAPYSEIETLWISDCRILTRSGTLVYEGESAPGAVCSETAEMLLSLPAVPDEDMILQINTFTAGSKADQPLEISGSWETDIFFER